MELSPIEGRRSSLTAERHKSMMAVCSEQPSIGADAGVFLGSLGGSEHSSEHLPVPLAKRAASLPPTAMQKEGSFSSSRKFATMVSRAFSGVRRRGRAGSPERATSRSSSEERCASVGSVTEEPEVESKGVQVDIPVIARYREMTPIVSLLKEVCEVGGFSYGEVRSAFSSSKCYLQCTHPLHYLRHPNRPSALPRQ